MPKLHGSLVLAALVAILLVSGARPAGAEPLFSPTDEGRTFLYRARPGDHPAGVAEMFGIPPHDLPAFLAANGIADPTRVGAGFTYRVPNLAARGLVERAEALERDKAQLTKAVRGAEERARELDQSASEAREAAAAADRHVARLARLERLWPWAQATIVLLVLAGGAAAYTAVAGLRRQAQAERYARTLARELEDKRKSALVERQESARRILDLETRIRTLEAQLGPRVVISGRGS